MSSNHATTTTTHMQEDHMIGPFAIVPKTDCPHLADRIYSFPASAQLVHGHQPPCKDCGEARENWVCLEVKCEYVGCSRYQQQHMLTHHQTTGHLVCLSLTDHSFYCYGCESYIDSPKFNPINQHFIDLSN